MKPEVITYDKPDDDVSAPGRIADVLVLAKVRLNALVVATTAGGYYMGAPGLVDPAALAAAAVGTALVASGAAAINQVSERDSDRLMERTRRRPVAAGRMSPTEGWLYSAAMAGPGLLILWLAANTLAAGVALVTLLSYALVYTPLKQRTPLATMVGAVPGALPPLIGWAAARGSLAGVEPWTLFALMFVWQLPHFLSIAWLYRDDYARAGLPMLSVVDPDGRLTGRQAALWAAALVPFSLLPFLVGLSERGYAIAALALGLALFAVAVEFARRRTNDSARRLFYASITYLPLLWTLMAIGRP